MSPSFFVAGFIFTLILRYTQDWLLILSRDGRGNQAKRESLPPVYPLSP